MRGDKRLGLRDGGIVGRAVRLGGQHAAQRVAVGEFVVLHRHAAAEQLVDPVADPVLHVAQPDFPGDYGEPVGAVVRIHRSHCALRRCPMDNIVQRDGHQLVGIFAVHRRFHRQRDQCGRALRRRRCIFAVEPRRPRVFAHGARQIADIQQRRFAFVAVCFQLIDDLLHHFLVNGLN